MTDIVSPTNLSYYWKTDLYQLEKDLEEERTRTNLIYSQNNTSSELDQRTTDYKQDELSGPIDWVAFHQKYFTISVIPERSIGAGKVTLDTDEENSEYLKTASAAFELPSANFLGEGINMRYYFGPNDYELLQKVSPNFDSNVYFGWGPLKWINKFFTLNVFNFLKSFIGNYFSGSFKNMVSFFAKKDDMDLQEFESLLEELKQEEKDANNK